MRTILLISPYWKEEHRWMVSSVKLADLWQRLGYRVVVACMGSKTMVEDPSPTLRMYHKKDFFLPDPWNYGIAFGFTGMVRKIIREEKPDIIVCNKILFWTSLALISLRARGIRALLITDALVGMTWWGRTWLFRFASRIYAWTLGWLIMLCADTIVFFHPQPTSLLKHLGVEKKSRVIPTGIDPQPFSAADINRQLSKEVTVTYVGRLESVKGVDDFLAAAVPLKKQYPNLNLRVVGWYPSTSSGQVNHYLVEQYRNDVHFTGLRHDIPAVLAETQIFVLPSHSEGLSNALMEAMASGCACIASEVGGNAFLIQNGVSGLLFPAGDREALAAHLRRLMEDHAKRKAMGEAARKRIEEHFSWQIVGNLYRDLFERFSSR